MSYEVHAVTKPRILGEGPHWDDVNQNLYFVDVFGSSVHRYRQSENRETHCKIHESASVSIVIPIKNSTNKFLVTIGNKLTIVTWDGESTKPENIEVIASVDGDPVKGRTQFNDGKVDSTGRLWIGTMGALDAKDGWKPELGSLYSLKKKETLIKHVEKISVSNGLVWNDEKKKMYYVDSPTHRIDEFDFDSEANKISNRRLFFDVKPFIGEGFGGPDGMTIDENGDLWVAVFGTGTILNVNGNSGKLIRKVNLPLLQVTSVAFGGKDLDELYVTSGAFKLSEQDKQRYPLSGCTLKITGLGVKGRRAAPADF